MFIYRNNSSDEGALKGFGRSTRECSTRSGASLLIGLLLISLLVLVAISVATTVVASIRQSSNVNQANKAYYAAEGGLETGLLVNKNAGAGYSNSPQQVLYGAPNCNPNQPSTCLTKAIYQVQGQVPQNTKFTTPQANGQYGIPTPGTGNAGTNCSTLTPIIAGSFTYPPSNDTAPAEDHPCNWNKITESDTVVIPLYVITADPNSTCPSDPQNPAYKICNPSDLNLTSINLRVRTPCSNNQNMCNPIYRYNLDLNNGETGVNKNDTIIDWQIIAKSWDAKKTYTLKPNRIYGINCKDESQIKPGRCYPLNSEVYESQINFKKDKGYSVLIQTKAGEDLLSKQLGTIINFLKNGFPWDIGGSLRSVSDDRINRPTLELSIIHDLQESGTGYQIPYLEYQILTNAPTTEPADYHQNIMAEGFSGSFKQVLQVKQQQQTGILDYVIQQ